MSQPGKPKKKILLLAALLLALLIAAAAAYFSWEKAPQLAPAPSAMPSPEQTAAAENMKAPAETPAAAAEPSPAATPEATTAPTAPPTPSPTPDPLESAEAPLNQRQDGVYTVLLVGEDKWTGNTDTILVGKIDTKAHKMDFVSLPRDTLINMDWEVRKLNSVYYKAKDAGRDPAAELKARVKELIGFEVDCYAVLNLEGFIQVIDAVGGVEFDVPQDIYFEDYTMVDGEWEDTYNCIYAGPQTLSGFQCMGLVRYRHGYLEGDLGRIKVQHDFLRACAKQFISLGNIPNVGKVIEILRQNMDTDLTTANIAFFLRQALLCKSEDINFHTMPSAPKMLNGYSYAVILVYDWQKMINEYLNPYEEPIGFNHLNVMYNDYIGIGCTGEVRGAWYYIGAAEADLAKLYGVAG